jgi:predicted Zn-dependent protease with MMP-like domain
MWSFKQVRADNGDVVEVEPEWFEQMVGDALDKLPEEFGLLLSNIAVMVDLDGGPPGLLGLYEGIPLTRRGTAYGLVAPDVITIYRQAICALCQTEQQVADQVRRTLIHEVGHYFGLDDARLRQLGW